QQLQERPIVVGLTKHRLPAISTIQDVVADPADRRSRSSRHRTEATRPKAARQSKSSMSPFLCLIYICPDPVESALKSLPLVYRVSPSSFVSAIGRLRIVATINDCGTACEEASATPFDSHRTGPSSLRAVIGRFDRFRNGKQLSRYCGPVLK